MMCPGLGQEVHARMVSSLGRLRMLFTSAAFAMMAIPIYQHLRPN